MGAIAPPVDTSVCVWNQVFLVRPYTHFPSLVQVGAFVFDLLREQRGHICGCYCAPCGHIGLCLESGVPCSTIHPCTKFGVSTCFLFLVIERTKSGHIASPPATQK